MSHINKLIDYTVCAYIIFNNEQSSSSSKVLLIHHKVLNKWLPIGGHIELDEDPEEGLIREIKEESGLEMEILSEKPQVISPGNKFLYTPNFLDIHDIDSTHKHVGFVYFCKAKSDQVKLAEKEHNQIRWFSKSELDDKEYKISEAVKFYSKKALELW